MKDKIMMVIAKNETKYSDLGVYINKVKYDFYISIGVPLFKNININPEEIGYKIFIAALYNSGVKLSIIKEVFGHDGRTVKKWSEALLTFNVEKIVKAFTGKKLNKLIIPEVIRYAQLRYKDRATLGRSYRKKIIEGIEEVFQVRVSGSQLSKIFQLGEDISQSDCNDLNNKKL